MMDIREIDVAQIGAKIKEIISNVTNIPIEEIGEDVSLTQELDLDSLSLLEIGVDIDYAFKLGLPDERLKEIGCVRDAVELVCRELAGRQVQTEVA